MGFSNLFELSLGQNEFKMKMIKRYPTIFSYTNTKIAFVFNFTLFSQTLLKTKTNLNKVSNQEHNLSSMYDVIIIKEGYCRPEAQGNCLWNRLYFNIFIKKNLKQKKKQAKQKQL